MSAEIDRQLNDCMGYEHVMTTYEKTSSLLGTQANEVKSALEQTMGNRDAFMTENKKREAIGNRNLLKWKDSQKNISSEMNVLENDFSRFGERHNGRMESLLSFIGNLKADLEVKEAHLSLSLSLLAPSTSLNNLQRR